MDASAFGPGINEAVKAEPSSDDDSNSGDTWTPIQHHFKHENELCLVDNAADNQEPIPNQTDGAFPPLFIDREQRGREIMVDEDSAGADEEKAKRREEMRLYQQARRSREKDRERKAAAADCDVLEVASSSSQQAASDEPSETRREEMRVYQQDISAPDNQLKATGVGVSGLDLASSAGK